MIFGLMRMVSGGFVIEFVFQMCQDLRRLCWWSGMNKDSTSMDFVSGLPRTPSTYEADWVIMDELTKFVYFIPFRMDYPMKRFAKLYLEKL